MTLTILGSTGSWPAARSACSGYLVRAEGAALLVDFGPGTMANLQRHVGLGDVTGVVISHGHFDHWSDLPSLGVAYRWGEKRSGVPVFAPAKATQYLDEAGPIFKVSDVAEGDEAEVGPFRLRFHETSHYVPNVAVRIQAAGRVLGYTGDTGPGWSPSVLGPVDVLLSEATFPAADEEDGAMHLSGRQAGALAAAASVPRLILTHFGPGHDRDAIAAEAAEAFGGPVEAAADHAVYDV